MKNFGTLFGYEMKKIWKRKLTWVVLVLLVVFVMYDTTPHFREGGITYHVEMGDGSELSRKISDQEQFKIELEGVRLLDGQIMDEVFFQKMRDSLPQRPSMEDDLEGYTNFDYINWFYLVDPTYFGFYRYMNPGLDMGTITADKYYTYYWASVAQYWKELNLSNNEIAFWEDMADQIEQPFTYWDVAGTVKFVSEVQSIIVRLLPLLVGICLCNIFPQERRRRVDTLIFSAPNGRVPLYLSKLLAGALSVIGLTTLLFFVAAAVVVLIYGGISLTAAVQLIVGSCWPITIGRFLLILLGFLIVYALLCGGLTMLTALLTGSSVAGLAVCIVPMLLDMLLPYSDAPYLPGNLISPQILRNFHLTNLFGIQFNTIQLGFLLYGGAAVLLLILCWPGWQRSAAGKV